MNRMRELRLSREWTQLDLGRRLGMNKAAVSKYETGRSAMTDGVIVQLCELFECSADYLLGLSDVRSCQTCTAKYDQEKLIFQDVFRETSMLQEDGTLTDGAAAVIQEFLSRNAGLLEKLASMEG